MTGVTRRRFLRSSLAGGLASTLRGRSTLAAPFSKAIGANDDIRVATIGLGEVGGPGVGARGRQLIDQLRKVPDVRIVALCDVDKQILAREMQRFAAWQESVTPYADMREVFDSPDIDAVFVATPNHWHALATVWACQAGKDVYVEKPASHSIWEGRQMVAAARKHKRIVQVGTQSRSSDVSQQAVEFLRSGRLGKILYAQAIVYRRRESIGKVTGPQTVPASVDYNSDFDAEGNVSNLRVEQQSLPLFRPPSGFFVSDVARSVRNVMPGGDFEPREAGKHHGWGFAGAWKIVESDGGHLAQAVSTTTRGSGNVTSPRVPVAPGRKRRSCIAGWRSATSRRSPSWPTAAAAISSRAGPSTSDSCPYRPGTAYTVLWSGEGTMRTTSNGIRGLT